MASVPHAVVWSAPLQIPVPGSRSQRQAHKKRAPDTPVSGRPGVLARSRGRLAARACNFGMVGEDLHSTMWAKRQREDAADQFERADALDEAIRLVFVRLPADVVIQFPTDPLGECFVDLDAH